MQLSSKLALVLCAILAAAPTRSAPTATGESDIAPRSPDNLALGSGGHFDQGSEDLADEGQSLADIVSFRRSTGDLPGDGGNSFHLVRRDGIDDNLGVDEYESPDKKETEKKKLDLIKKIHDKEIKAAEVLLVQKISFFYEDKDDHLLHKFVDKEKLKKAHGGGKKD
ncbi:unnamed protein product [Tilletia controversa]|uniref:RxLR effector protein n=1 Tax=Tilletia controversa TaxID=13291 RepID=A0A8X7MQG9_9BASI|nr:hypothetical protein CF328_g4722 [Tilletia controversa]KAE8245766.1 hypothetical protein A4X06_0g5437 [Tilletia controversa]CAD6917727.1 unnamed protein product [Tilletia controversa]CAD6976360.1 unnamed protein product [Tilletia controversa]CAD6986226.1 unnamed protein product [Tilletia controversa]